MESVLLLDFGYSALNIVPWKKALKLIVKGKVEPVHDSSIIKSLAHSGKNFNIPSTVRLLRQVPWRAHESKLKFSRKNIMARDEWQCAYCSRVVDKNSSTIDHVIPRSRGGATNYTNCVLCCKRCNNMKGNRTPEEAGLKLKIDPRIPLVMSVWRALWYKDALDIPEEWYNFI